METRQKLHNHVRLEQNVSKQKPTSTHGLSTVTRLLIFRNTCPLMTVRRLAEMNGNVTIRMVIWHTQRPQTDGQSEPHQGTKQATLLEASRRMPASHAQSSSTAGFASMPRSTRVSQQPRTPSRA